MSQKFCPRCGSPRIRVSTAFSFGITPLKYFCEECGYNGPIIMEADLPSPATKNKIPISFSVLRCPNCGYENSSNSNYCGKCGASLREEETRIY